MKVYKLLVLFLFGIFLTTSSFKFLTRNVKEELPQVNWKKVSVLVYTKNGKGYVHDNIPSAVACIQKLGQQHGFKVETSDNPNVFTQENLQKFTFVLFASTNNDVFDTDAQRLSFRRYIEAGGGFVGLHSVTGTERNWTWFKMMVGGTFDWHVPFMPFKVKVIEKRHPSVQGLPKVWDRIDECYFTKEMYPGIKVLMAHDLSFFGQKEKEEIKKRSAAGSFGNFFPAVWYQHFDGGTIWVTTLGHDKKDYQDPIHIKHIFQGMAFVAGQVQKLNYAQAYAITKDSPLP